MDPSRAPWRLRGLPSASPLGIEVPLAARLRARLLGLSLLPRERAGAGLLIDRCSSVHSFGMRFALDLVFLGDGGAVLRIERAVRPCRVRSCAGARAVLELPSGAITAFSVAWDIVEREDAAENADPKESQTGAPLHACVRLDWPREDGRPQPDAPPAGGGAGLPPRLLGKPRHLGAGGGARRLVD